MYFITVIQTEGGYFIEFQEPRVHKKPIRLAIDKEQAEEMESNGFIIESK